MELHPAVLAAGVELIEHDVIDSTNAEALRRGRAGEVGPLWVVAGAQTAGRGRRGRSWVSDRGNLHASLLLTDPSPPRHAAQLSFVAALAVRDAVVEVAPALAPRIALKWPNDVLCDGRKIAGILIEGEGAHPLVVAIGVGVNCQGHPTETEYPATDLAAAGSAVSAGELFTALSAHMMARLRQWNEGAGFPAIRSEWMKSAFGYGAELRVRLPGHQMTGRFEMLDQDGRLVLRLPDGTAQAIAAGEVFPIAVAETAADR